MRRSQTKRFPTRLTARELLLDRVFDGVRVFADGAPQSDDITALALTFLGG